MKETKDQREDRLRPEDDAVEIPHVAAGHLRAAFEQMELLLKTQQVDAGLCYLVSLLQHLRAAQRFVA